MFEKVSYELRGEELTIETGKYAKQANGSVFVRHGGTVVMATVCASKEPNLALDYFPLQVNYGEKYYAAGKIPGGFIKREGRPRDKEILISRLIDRPIRPLFPTGFRNEVQVLPTAISADQINPPDILAMIAASAALTVSDIPYNGPIGAVRVGKIDDELIINPTFLEIKDSSIELIVAGTNEGITMIEGSAHELGEDEVVEALEFAHKYIKEIIDVQNQLKEKAGKEKMEVELQVKNEEIEKEIRENYFNKFKEGFQTEGKLNRQQAIDDLIKEIKEHYKEKLEEEELPQINEIIEEIEYEIVRDMILIEDKRVDDRVPDEMRELSCEIGILPRTHGSSIFTRGETQSMGVITLGTSLDEQRLDDIEGEDVKAFMLHYNFLPFSVGEVGRIGATSRREIGHGNLAERSLIPVLPDKEKFPYTIRVVSEILESNGSSSMATVCSGTLALLDAGVPIKSSVAGIAMGLIWDKENNKYKILTDIQGLEDHLGDMDFKVAGTRNGITAFQLDIKVDAISIEIMKEALVQAKNARYSILDVMDNTIKETNPELSLYAPKIITMEVETEKIREIIGPGGSVIRNIIDKTGANVAVDDDGSVAITSKDEEGAKKAYEMIKDIVAEVEIGKTYQGKVTRIENYGAFIEVLPGKEGLCHISKLSDQRVRNVTDVVQEGDTVSVKVVGKDEKGRIDLSMLDESSSSSYRSGSGNRSRGRSGDRHGGNRRHRR